MRIAANSSVLAQLPFVNKNLKKLHYALCLTEFYFHRTVCKQKNSWRNLTVSQYFRPVVKMGPKTGKTLVIGDCCGANFSLQRDAYYHFQENRLQSGITSYKLLVLQGSLNLLGSLADSVLKLSTKIDIFIKHPKK